MAETSSGSARFRAFIRENRSVLIGFVAAASIFVAGLVNLLGGLGDEGTFDDRTPDAPGGGEVVRVGPDEGEGLGPYLARKEALVRARAAEDPEGTTVAALYLDSYAAAPQVEGLLPEGGDGPTEVMVRVPLPEFAPQTLEVGRSGMASAIESWAKALLVGVQEEVSDLEAIIPTVQDQEFRQVYLADLEIQRRAAATLASEHPQVVFAVVLRESHSTLLGLLGEELVRAVDLPEPPAASSDTVRFSHLLPEAP